MNEQVFSPRPPWSRHLDVVGAELFRRYRKRLMQPGISWEIRADYPGLGWVDIWIRVHEARKIIRDGDDFAALAAIRRGWRASAAGAGNGNERRSDRVSRGLVLVGRAIVAGFLLLSLLSLATARGDSVADDGMASHWHAMPGAPLDRHAGQAVSSAARLPH